MQVDPAQHNALDGYRLLTNLVTPRPIAWVTTLHESGAVNLAPFSFFNAISSDPLQVMVSVGARDDDSQKDTATNIIRTGEFVVNMVTEELLPAMNISAAEYPPQVSELESAGLHAAPSTRISTPRLLESPASLECVLRQQVPTGDNILFIGEVVMFHVADTLIESSLRISGFAPIGRMGSPATYCRTTDRFELPRIKYKPQQ
jgi:flavin reductase (DIM6/NTAB) family NADH-FMN oxidoreductase RutF